MKKYFQREDKYGRSKIIVLQECFHCYEVNENKIEDYLQIN